MADLKAKLEFLVSLSDVLTGTKVVSDAVLGEFLVSEYQTWLIKLDPNVTKTLDISDLNNIEGVFMSVQEGSASFKVDPTSTILIDFSKILLQGTVPNLIISAGSSGAVIKVIVISRKV